MKKLQDNSKDINILKPISFGNEDTCLCKYIFDTYETLLNIKKSNFIAVIKRY